MSAISPSGLYIDKDLQNHLLNAIEEHDNDLVMRILASEKYIKHYKKLNINDAFLCSITKQNTIAFDALIAEGAHLNYRDRLGKTPLFYALDNKNISLFNRLIALGADVHAHDDKNNTLILCAAENNNIHAVQTLIAAKVDLDIKTNGSGATALSVAVKHGHTQCLDALIYAGANINSMESMMDLQHGSYWISPFLAAIKYDQLDSVRQLVAAGVNIFEKHEKLKDAWSLAKENGCLDIINYLNAHVEQQKLSLLVPKTETQNAMTF